MNRRGLLEELRRDVHDERVLAAIAAVPRDRFVGPLERHRAWRNRARTIGCGQTISQPLIVALMCQALAVRPGERVLEIGTGSGYHAAVLAALGARVWSLERHAELAESAARRLAELGIDTVEVVLADGTQGHPPAAPYDAISVTACAPGDVPAELIRQLAAGGRLVAPVAADGDERLVLIERDLRGDLRRTVLQPVRFVPLLEGLGKP